MGFTLTSYDPINIRVANVYKQFAHQTDDNDGVEDSAEEAMDKSNPHFEALVLSELSKRLVEEISQKDVPESDTLSNYRITCAIDALIDYLGIEVADDEIIELIPFGCEKDRLAIKKEMEQAGMGDMLMQNVKREKATRLLLDQSNVTLV